MEINSRLDYGLLRNPLFIASFLLVSIVPEVAIYCTNVNAAHLLSSCSRETVNVSFIQNSFLSSSLVFVGFESQRICLGALKFWTTPRNLHTWGKVHVSLFFISLITFIAFFMIRITILWISGNEILFSEIFLPNIMLKVLAIVFLSYYSLTLYSVIKNKMHPLKKVVLTGENSDKKVELGDIHFFKKQDRKYFLKTFKGLLPIKMTLKELELKLPKQYFVRVNRSVIINIREIESYNYWEHEKYILKIKSGEEFIVTRMRILKLKQFTTEMKK